MGKPPLCYHECLLYAGAWIWHVALFHVKLILYVNKILVQLVFVLEIFLTRMYGVHESLCTCTCRHSVILLCMNYISTCLSINS